MATTGTLEFPSGNESIYDREKELKHFDDTKAGVKGLIDAGVVKVPQIFLRPQENLGEESFLGETLFEIPVIDFKGIDKDKVERKKIVDEIRKASETWGFFQVVNHEVPVSVLDEMIKGIRRFFEEEDEVKKQFYTRDHKRKVRYSSNVDLFVSKAANWRDTMQVSLLTPDLINPGEIPATCRETTMEYGKRVIRLGDTLLELISEALGLKPGHLRDMDCTKGCTLSSHYYPACPEPELTIGTVKHTDPTFITILLQDNIGGLQVNHQNHWVHVKPIHGALVVNIGDLLQVMSNDKFKSVQHRVLANRVGPRISAACFLSTHFDIYKRLYGPIKELVSEDNPPAYKEFSLKDFLAYFLSNGLDAEPPLSHFKL